MTCPQSSIAPRRRRWALGLVGVVFTATIALVADPVAADPIEDQRQRVTELTDELERLAEASDILAEEFVTAIDEQRRLESEVVVAEQQVAERQGEVDALRSELGAVAVQTFMGAGTNGLGPMLDDSQAYTEQLQRDQLARVALSSGDATTDQLDVAVEDLKAQRSTLEDKRAAAVAAAADVEAAKRENDAKKAEYENARTGAESELGRLIQEEEERAGSRVLRADGARGRGGCGPRGGRGGGPAGGGRCGRRGRGAAAGRRRGVSRCAGGRCASDPSGTANARRARRRGSGARGRRRPVVRWRWWRWRRR